MAVDCGAEPRAYHVNYGPVIHGSERKRKNSVLFFLYVIYPVIFVAA